MRREKRKNKQETEAQNVPQIMYGTFLIGEETDVSCQLSAISLKMEE